MTLAGLHCTGLTGSWISHLQGPLPASAHFTDGGETQALDNHFVQTYKIKV